MDREENVRSKLEGMTVEEMMSSYRLKSELDPTFAPDVLYVAWVCSEKDPEPEFSRWHRALIWARCRRDAFRQWLALRIAPWLERVD